MRDNGITEANRVLPKYPGDDTRPTSKEELAGWYSYGWAAEVFAVCGIGIYPSWKIRPLLGQRACG